MTLNSRLLPPPPKCLGSERVPSSCLTYVVLATNPGHCTFWESFFTTCVIFPAPTHTHFKFICFVYVSVEKGHVCMPLYGGNFQESVLSFHRKGQTLVFGIGIKCIYPTKPRHQPYFSLPSKIINTDRAGMVTHAFNSNPPEAEAVRSLSA